MTTDAAFGFIATAPERLIAWIGVRLAAKDFDLELVCQTFA
jgi:hypothetical protein